MLRHDRDNLSEGTGRGQRDGSAAKSDSCYCGGLTSGRSQLPVTPAPGDPMPFSALLRQPHMCSVSVHKKHSQKEQEEGFLLEWKAPWSLEVWEFIFIQISNAGIHNFCS